MKNICILLLLFYWPLYALEKESTLKMYHGIFSSLLSKSKFLVYAEDKEYKEVFKFSKKIILTKQAKYADIVLITNESMLDYILKINQSAHVGQKLMLFVTDYRFLKKSENIVGAFYWRKGRSQLLFIKKRLQQYQITLPKQYQTFMVDDL